VFCYWADAQPAATQQRDTTKQAQSRLYKVTVTLEPSISKPKRLDLKGERQEYVGILRDDDADADADADDQESVTLVFA
jgi:hypothetical protein